MSQPNPSNPGAVVIDANILISICSKEPNYQTAENALADYAAKGWVFFAPGAILTEVLFILCKKLQDGLLTAIEHQKAVEAFNDYMKMIHPTPLGDIPLILRAEEIRRGYSCLHSADGFYIALTEELAKSGAAEFLTFDKRVVNVAAHNAPSVKINLLT
ncbi:MAG: type II toxin-antitoxin system VapC family toxin [Blastocatellia bacterium]